MLADYLVVRYPKVIFHSDFGSGVKLSFYQANLQKRQKWRKESVASIFIAKPCDEYAGLFIELKRDGARIKKRDGSYTSDHIAEQAKFLSLLEDQGYLAVFAVGFDEARRVIDSYRERVAFIVLVLRLLSNVE